MNRKKLRSIRVNGVLFGWRYNERCWSLVFEPLEGGRTLYARVVLHFPPLAYCSHLCNPLYMTPRYVAQLINDGIALGWPRSRKTSLHQAWFALMHERFLELSAEACGSRERKRNQHEELRKVRTELLSVLLCRKTEIVECNEKMADLWGGALFRG